MKKYALIKDSEFQHFKVAETKPIIAPNKGEYYEVQENEMPEISETEVATKTAELVNDKWVITHEKRDKTTEELNQMWATKNTFDGQKARVLLQKVVEPLINVDDPTQQDIEAAKSVYKHYQIGVTYDKDSDNIDERFFVYNDKLYKVIGVEHTSQADWKPDIAVSLYVEVRPDEVTVWEQPSAENPYMTGDRVYFPTAQDDIYESLIDDNVWSPTAYPAGWEVV